MKLSSYLIILVFIFYSCTSQKIAHGVYFENWHDSYHSLKLNPDSTFIYTFKEGLLFDSISGKWRIVKSKLILNSFLSFKDTKSFLEYRICDTCHEGFNIKVIDFESKVDLQYTSLTAYNQGNVVSELATNEIGNVIIKNQEVDSIKVDYVGYDSFTFMPNYNADSLIIINMKLEELRRKVITDGVWKIKKNQLVSPKGFVLRKLLLHSESHKNN